MFVNSSGHCVPDTGEYIPSVLFQLWSKYSRKQNVAVYVTDVHAPISLRCREELRQCVENLGSSQPGANQNLTTYLSKPFTRLDRYPSLLKELECDMGVRVASTCKSVDCECDH